MICLPFSLHLNCCLLSQHLESNGLCICGTHLRTADIDEPNGHERTEKTNRTSLKTSMGTPDSLAVSGCLCHSPSRDAGSELPQALVISSLILIDLIVSTSQTVLVLMWCLPSALSTSSGCPEEGTYAPLESEILLEAKGSKMLI